MSNRARRVPFAPEMNSFQAEVGCNQRLVAAAKLEHSTVISDAGENTRPRMCQAANARNQRLFCERQDSITIFTNCGDAKQQLWFFSEHSLNAAADGQPASLQVHLPIVPRWSHRPHLASEHGQLAAPVIRPTGPGFVTHPW
jgi:hypothetical protein